MTKKPECAKMADGTEEWRLDGVYHREDGPAVIWPYSGKFWYRHGVIHREDGPAFEGNDGSQEWSINGQTHRTDGPAIIWSDGRQEWWLNDVRYNCVEWLVRVYELDQEQKNA